MISVSKPNLFILAGPNGSGKTTVAEFLLQNRSLISYVNADIIAKGLNLNLAGLGDFEAGRILLAQVHKAVRDGNEIAFESTLAGKGWRRFIERTKERGYEITICFVCVESAEIAVRRIQVRVSEGGHSVPEDVVRRRYLRSLKQFFSIYRSLVDNWYFFDNTADSARLIAKRENSSAETIYNPDLFRHYEQQY